MRLARQVVGGGSEVHWRGAAIHAYYALVLECRDTLVRWGTVIPRGQNMHAFVRLRLNYSSDPDLKSISDELDVLVPWRTKASYEMNPGTRFATDQTAREAIRKSTAALALLDTIDGDAGRRAAAVASLPP